MAFMFKRNTQPRTCVHVPEPRGVSGPGSHKRTTVRAELYCPNFAAMYDRLNSELTCNHIPQPHGMVGAGGGKRTAVRAELYREDIALMFEWLAAGLTSLHVPESRGVVIVTGGKNPAVRTERHYFAHDAIVPTHVAIIDWGGAETAGGYVPKSYCEVIAVCGERPAVGTELYLQNSVVVIGHGRFWHSHGPVVMIERLAAGLSGRQVPQPYGIIEAGRCERATVGAEGHMADGGIKVKWAAVWLTGRDVPQRSPP